MPKVTLPNGVVVDINERGDIVGAPSGSNIPTVATGPGIQQPYAIGGFGQQNPNTETQRQEALAQQFEQRRKSAVTEQARSLAGSGAGAPAITKFYEGLSPEDQLLAQPFLGKNVGPAVQAQPGVQPDGIQKTTLTRKGVQGPVNLQAAEKQLQQLQQQFQQIQQQAREQGLINVPSIMGVPSAKQPSAEQPVTPAPAPTSVQIPVTPQTPADADNILGSSGLSDLLKAPSIEEVVKTISSQFGFTGVLNEMQKIDDTYSDELTSINTNPWISESLRTKKVSAAQDKYERKRDQAVNRLRLQQDIVGRATDLYYKQKEMQKDVLFKALDLKSRELDRQRLESQGFELSPGQVRFNAKGEPIASVPAAPKTESALQEQLTKARIANIESEIKTRGVGLGESRDLLNELRRLQIEQLKNVSPGQIINRATGIAAKTTQTENEMLTRSQQASETYIPQLQQMLKDVSTGAIKGNLNKYTAKVPIAQYLRSDDLSMFNALASYFSQQIVYMNSGKQINEQEMKILAQSLPSSELTVSENQKRLAQFKKISDDSFNRYLRLKGWAISGNQADNQIVNQQSQGEVVRQGQTKGGTKYTIRKR